MVRIRRLALCWCSLTPVGGMYFAVLETPMAIASAKPRGLAGVGDDRARLSTVCMGHRRNIRGSVCAMVHCLESGYIRADLGEIAACHGSSFTCTSVGAAIPGACSPHHATNCRRAWRPSGGYWGLSLLWHRSARCGMAGCYATNDRCPRKELGTPWRSNDRGTGHGIESNAGRSYRADRNWWE